MAGQAGQVLGVEVVPEAIADAKENARLNGICNAHFTVGRAEAPKQWFQGDDSPGAGTADPFPPTLSFPDRIVVDPPRRGLDEAAIRLILNAAPARLVYVSCNPSTLARDLALLGAGGYELSEYTPFDAFCHSGHVETVALLEHK